MTMRAWQYASTTPSGIEQHMHLTTTLPAPDPSALTKDIILIETLYAGLNPADFKTAELPLIKYSLGLPVTPGFDFCGRVKSRDIVFGGLGHPKQLGTLSESFIAPLSKTEAAGISAAGTAAYKALAPYVKAGDKVFVNGGSGGVGIFAIQIARVLGAEVTVTCSTRNVEFCRGLGAQRVIDYTQGDLVELLVRNGVMFDHVVDNVGADARLYQRAELFTAPGARIAQVGIQGRGEGGWRRHVLVLGWVEREELERLGGWVSEGRVRVCVDEVFGFEGAVAAFTRLRTGRARGRIVVKVGDSI
ncbi:NAD(P)-binding protein [Aspergillus ellipticus CBS 707.79]|uniref:NAD(P)-binding protein n=1 Tax=Aspergillus ellipticus CBS 707.79 TaxID=1448320 RepID=A0A319CV56_9EURO|nr:NAD(P)-binding protein [Aspergillus ellipticus CBS 707.79]